MIFPTKSARAKEYHTDQSYQWIRDLGDDIVNNSATLITTANLAPATEAGIEHWVMIIIQGGVLALNYGDSFGKDMPKDLQVLYEWWMNQHTRTELL